MIGIYNNGKIRSGRRNPERRGITQRGKAGWNNMLLKMPILSYAATSLVVQDKCLATGLRGN